MLRLLITRYFAGLRRRSVVGALSAISVLGVAVSTGAMVIVLSAFNGLEGLIRQLHESWDPGLKIEPTQGKFFEPALARPAALRKLEGVAALHPVVEDNALLRFNEGQAVVRLKGVEPAYGQRPGLAMGMRAGRFELGVPGAWGLVLGAGLQYELQVPLNAGFTGLQVWYPRAKKALGLDPRSAFSRQAAIATGVFQVEKQYDERYVFADIRLAAELMERPGQVTALEVDLAPGTDPDALAAKVQHQLGPAFRVLTSKQQHQSLMRVLRLERLFVYLALTVILLISSFNIFTALSMLGVEKRRDLAVLLALGAQPRLLLQTFLGLGLAISGLGATLGVGLGLALCWAQQRYKLVSMGMQTSIVEEYPVEVHQADLWLTALTVIAVSLAVSWAPARAALRSRVREV